MQGRNQQPQDGGERVLVDNAMGATVKIGSLLNDRFLLQALLGEGGMGKVYKALDLRREEVQDPNPYVAIKLLNENIRHVAGAGIALQREAVIAQRLQHPNIASVYDFNRDEHNAYIVMELIEGYTLDQLIISDYPDGLPRAQSFNTISQLIETVLFAHQQGIIHADIKPSNIKMMPSGGIKVMDFGLSRVMSLMNMTQHRVDKAVDSQWRHRSLNDAITPSYATRARLHGRQPIKVDDTYALACVVYLILTGRHPYQRMNADKVLKQGIKPKRPLSLTHTQWSLLQRALDPNINKDSELLNDLATAFCTRKRKIKHQVRKGLAVAALLLFCGTSMPVYTWVDERLPVWEIRYSDGENQLQQLTHYVADYSQAKQHALEEIYLSTLSEDWLQRWSSYQPLLTKPLTEQKAWAALLQRDVLMSDLVAPYFIDHPLFAQSKAQLEQTRSKYVIDVLMNYERQLDDYLTTAPLVSVSDFLDIYTSAMLLELIAGSSELIQADPRLNTLLRQSMDQNWLDGRYFPLAEKLNMVDAILPQAPDISAAADKLRHLMLRNAGTFDESPKRALFFEGGLLAAQSERAAIDQLYTPIIERLVKEIKIATSNQLDIHPVYLDHLTEIHRRFISLGGDEYRWKRVLAKADLEYGRSLARWGQPEKAFQLAEQALTMQLRF